MIWNKLSLRFRRIELSLSITQLCAYFVKQGLIERRQICTADNVNAFLFIPSKQTKNLQKYKTLKQNYPPNQTKHNCANTCDAAAELMMTTI